MDNYTINGEKVTITTYIFLLSGVWQGTFGEVQI